MSGRISEVPMGNPGDVRRVLQTKYDGYMGKEQLILGVNLPNFDARAMGSNEEERAEAYEDLASRWPRRSRALVTAIAKELIFEDLCMQNHQAAINGLFPEMTEKVSEGSFSFGYISGMGRNAVMFSRLAFSPEHSPEYGTLITSNRLVSLLLETVDFGGGLMVDADLGMGNITGPTPELFSPDGSQELSDIGFGQLVGAVA